jgi:hypothetical protein
MTVTGLDLRGHARRAVVGVIDLLLAALDPDADPARTAPVPPPSAPRSAPRAAAPAPHAAAAPAARAAAPPTAAPAAPTRDAATAASGGAASPSTAAPAATPSTAAPTASGGAASPSTAATAASGADDLPPLPELPRAAAPPRRSEAAGRALPTVTPRHEVAGREDRRHRPADPIRVGGQPPAGAPASAPSAPTPPAEAPAAATSTAQTPAGARAAASPEARQAAHQARTRLGLLRFVHESGGRATLRALHEHSERTYFVAHMGFSRVMEQLTDEGLLDFDHDTGIATLTDAGRAEIT